MDARDVVRSVASSLALVSVLACVPDLSDDRGRIAAPRILAVRAVPAEPKPGETVTLTALLAAPPDVPTGADALEWATCLARKPLTELGPVAQECIDRFGSGGDPFQRIGRGPSVTATVPADACRLFGPLVPPAPPGGVSGRPVDPDPSGGYYQPVVVGNELGTALASVRIACGVSGVPSAEAVRYNQGARPNENPEIERLEIASGGAVAPGTDGPGGVVAAGARVDLRVIWAACPARAVCGDAMCTAGENQSSCPADCRDAPRGCTGAETYLWASPETRTVQERRERITISWFANHGVFAEEQTGTTEDEADRHEASNVWTAPSLPGLVRLWLVIRDDRGGAGWREYVVRVE